MDVDLFEIEDCGDFFSSIPLEPTQQLTQEICTDLPEFQCSGEDSLHADFSANGFLRKNFLNQQCSVKILLSSFNFDRINLNCHSVKQFIFGEACTNLQYLYACVRGPIGVPTQLTYYQCRSQVTQLLHLLLQNTHEVQWKMINPYLINLRNLINRITDAENWKLLYYANSSKGNESNIPAYHLLHGVLEWKLLDLCLLQKYKSITADTENKDNTLLVLLQLERIFDDLLICSIYLFAKKNTVELLHSSPFPCTCIKEFWLFLQLALQKWSFDFKDTIIGDDNLCQFWYLFNRAIERIETKLDFYKLNAVSYCEFVIWLLSSLTRLFGYRSNGQFVGPNYTRASDTSGAENYEFCEKFTQKFLQTNPDEKQLRIYLCLLKPILLDWWRPKVNIPMLLWEYFHKRMNSSFYITGEPLSNLAVSCASGCAYLERYRILLEKQQSDPNLSSFTQFVLLLGKCLNQLLKAHLDNHGLKLLGRIYTKFGPQKFLTFNETGIHHLIELFIVLALSGNYTEMSTRLCDYLLSISLEKITPTKQVAVTKGHMAFLILSAEHRIDISQYVSKLLKQLLMLHNDIAVSKIIADGLLDIFKLSDDFRLGEHLLIDAWLPNFLNNCTQAEQDRCLEALHLVFVKIQNNELYIEANGNLLNSLNTIILPYLKQQYVSNFSIWLPQLAADFCIHSCAVLDTHTFQKLFQFFAEAQVANREALPIFLLKIMESDKSSLVDSTTIMHIWLKSLVLLTSVNEAVANLTKLIAHRPEFRYMTNLEPDEILRAKEPLCVFISAIGRYYDACTNNEKRCTIADNLNAYLMNIEKWLQVDIKVEKTELLFRFYSFIAIVIFNCPNIVYKKSKITCFFHVAMTRFILPTSIQMGKTPDVKQTQLIHKVWPVLLQGIGRLNFQTDPYLNKALTDLIQKWTPYFKISTNSKVVARPFINCMKCDNYELSLFVYQKLTSLFLITQRRQADPNACMIITIFSEVLEAIADETTENEKRLEVFIKSTSLLTLEHIMMVDEIVPSRIQLFDFYKRLINSKVFCKASHLQELLAENLRLLGKKNLAYFTFIYFELLMKMVQISYQLVERIMNFLINEVRIVEQKRGAGEDNRMRGCLLKLQQTIAQAKAKQ